LQIDSSNVHREKDDLQMADNPEIELGQQVWREGRPHRTKPNWFSAYGRIVDINREDDDDPDSEIMSVCVLFDDNTVDEIHPTDLDIWHERSECWQIFKG
jgi:hypothetical protein